MPTHVPNRVTLQDVAAAAGVSHMTVSRVVRGSRRVSPATAARISTFIKQLGYRPDPALAALSTYRTARKSQGKASRHLGVMAYLECANSNYSEIVFAGATREAESLGYTVDRIPIRPEFEMQRRLSQTLFHRGIQGLLFGPTTSPWQHLDAWEMENFAPVSLGVLVHSPRMPSIAMNHFQAALTGCVHLQELGCKHIGMVLTSELMETTERRWLGGYIAGLRGRNKPRLLVKSDISSLKGWVQKEKVDGVLTVHADLHPALRRMKVKLALLNSINPIPNVPRLAFHPAWIGAEGVAHVHNLLLRNHLGYARMNKTIELQGRWVNDNCKSAEEAFAKLEMEMAENH